MHGRFWVPKNISVYAFFFLAAAAAWTGILCLYYRVPELTDRIGEEAARLFDFSRAGSLGQWFLTLMWLGISFFSLMMVVLVRSRKKLHAAVSSVPKEINGATVPQFAKYHGVRRALFWALLGIFALVMSADTVCGFIPRFFHRTVEAVRASAGENGDISPFVISVFAIGLCLLGIVVSALRDYVRGLSLPKLCLRGAFGLTLLLLAPSLFFALTVPRTALNSPAVPRDPAAAEAPAAKTDPAKTDPAKTDPAEADPEPGQDDPADAEPFRPESSYRTISRERKQLAGADPASGGFTLESVFGMNVSFEKKLSLNRTIEESLHLKKSLESYLFDRFPKLNLSQARTFLRRGFYGYFLALLAGSLGLLARIERKEYDELIVRQALLRMQTPPSAPSKELFKDMWKFVP